MTWAARAAQHSNQHVTTSVLLIVSMLAGLMASIAVTTVDADRADAGVFFNDTEFTYKEYWSDHASYTAGCGAGEVSGNSFYIEPDGCVKTIELDIPDDTSGAIAAVVYVDLWRNRPSHSARFTINDGPQYRPSLGTNFSRTPFTATVPLTQLQQGTNLIKFQDATGPYHVHDVMVRVYYDDTNPLIPGPNSDIAAPDGVLTAVQAVEGPVLDPAVGGSLQVDGNQVVLTATATGNPAYVEFHAFYDGYDEDNDGETVDWHNFIRNNYGPNGTETKATGATIGHIGTDGAANQAGEYSVTWNLPEVINQTGVKFKIRVVDASGNAREVAGGASADFSLDRTYSVESYTIPNFPDQALFFDGVFPQIASLTIDLPTDLADIDRAILLGNYWNNPDISINDNPPFAAFEGPEDTWDTSKREVDLSFFQPGENIIRWNYRPPGFGVMIEGPGPMVVIHRDAPSGAPAITIPPGDVTITEGQTAALTVAATGAPSLGYQWLLDGNPIIGATSSSYSTPALLRADDGSKYSVQVTNGLGTVVSSEATVYVASLPSAAAPWWDLGWDYRVPLTAFPEGVTRDDKVIERFLDFSALMAAAGAGGPTFDANSIRVVEVDDVGTVIDPAVPFQFDPDKNYDPVSNAVGTLVWQLVGTTAPGVARSYHVYFDKTLKAIPPTSVGAQIVRTDVIDEGFEAYRFDLDDNSTWYFHPEDGGGFSKIIDADGADWIAWSTAPGAAGDFRGYPNAVKPPGNYFHPGRSKKTKTTIVHEGPLRVTLETRAKDNSWIAIWEMYPTYSEMFMTRANKRFWVQYEGVPGGEVDPADFIQRSDGVTIPIDGTFESDLPGQEWMYSADPTDGRSFYIAHFQDDGAVESYSLLDGAMTVMAFGRGGLNLNNPYLRKVENGQPQKFTAGLADSTAFGPTGDHIRAAYLDVGITSGAAEFNGVNSGPITDDFSGSTLASMWTYTDPVGDTTVTLTGSNLVIDIPAGPTHDLWTNRDFAPRLLQPVGNEDLDVVAAFDSVPTTQFQGQGLLFYEDSDNWIRLSVEHDGTRAKAVIYQMINGTAQQIAKKNLPGVATRFLRAIRTGDSWKFQRSYNGTRWFNFQSSYDLNIDLKEVGIFATTHGSTAPAYTASVDYFESKTSGEVNDDAPQISNVVVTPSARSATISWDTNVDADTRVDHGPSIDLGEIDIDLTPTMSHSITIDYLRCDTPYFVRPRSTSAVGSTIGDLVTLATAPCPTIVSDDLSTGVLGPHWTVVDPLGDTSLSLSATNVVISVPADVDHNLFPAENFATRLRQAGPVGDFSVDAKFESVLTNRFQMQGIVVEEDDDSYLRFEIHHDGTEVRAFMAAILDDVATTHYSGALPASTEQYMRVSRAGNTWTMWHSIDGVNFTQLATMVIGIESAYVGPYIGTTATGNGSPPAFLGSIDYFFNTPNPIVPEDGGAGPDIDPPVITNIVVQPGVPDVQATTITWDTDEPATTRVEWGLTSGYGAGPYIENTAVNAHTAIISPLICGTTYHFEVSSNDASGNIGQSSNDTFSTAACPAGPFSDNFDTPDLDSRWLVDDPRGDSSFETPSGLLALSVIAGVRHDLTPNNNGAFRVLQPVPDTDFQVIVGFESVVNFRAQLQGLVFEQDDDNLVRFDLFSDGTDTRAFVGTLTSGPAKLTTLANEVVQGAIPGALRVTRTGDNWLFEYSPDRRQTWQTIYTGTITLDIARIGPFAGNANPQLASVPPHTAVVDYFWSSSDPITITEPGALEQPQFTIFGGTGPIWDGLPLEFGAPGLAQPDVNVRGRVTDLDGIASMTYSVNGGQPVTMGIGTTDCTEGVSCTRRLALDGDFNADVDSSLLTAGLNTVTIRAVDNEFNAATIDIPVNYTPGATWPLPYSVDWSSVTDLYDVSQPIDGRWVTAGDTVRVDEIGYDRLLAFGDNSWSSFEAEVDITINSFDPAGYLAPSGGPGIGFIPHWRGHIPEDFVQPKFGFSGQLGALVWYRYHDDANGERLEIRDSEATLVAEDLSGLTLTQGVTFTFKMQSETGGGAGPTYRLKAWEAGTTEPADWNIVTALPPSAPDFGSLLLVAHHVDADFGDLFVREITATAPVISPDAGTYAGIAKIEMSTTTRAGEIRYTLNGDEPTEASALFTEPFFINESKTIKAKVFRAGFVPSTTTQQTYSILPPPDRVDDDLQALYRFDEDSGTSVSDTALVGDPIDMVIEAGSDVTWLPAQDALRINGPSSIRTALGAPSLNNAIKSSQAFTVELWIDPASLQTPDGTLFNIASEVPNLQNFALTQQGLTLDTALRTTNSDDDGQFSLNSGAIVPSQLHHLVYVRRPDNTVALYIDGLLAWDGYRGGNLNAWAAGYGLSVGNTLDGVNPWTGDLYLLAVYSDDLTETEIATNYQSGPFPPPANFAPVVNAGSDITLVEGEVASMAATAFDDGNPIPPGVLVTTWIQLSGPATAVLTGPSSPTTDVTLPTSGTYVFDWVGNDGEKVTSDQMQITVIPAGSQAPPPTVTPPAGSYPGSVVVTMSSTVPSAEIRYTTDGSDPTATSDLYTSDLTFSVSVTVKARTFRVGLADSDIVTRNYLVTPDSRVDDGLLVFYPFNEPNGASIKDKGPLPGPLNLKIANVGRTTRVQSGVRLDQPTDITSVSNANKINNAVKTSGEVTVELWLTPADDTQSDAMILGLSANKNARNLGILQETADLDVYLRTKATNGKGEPPTHAATAVAPQLTHLVFTRDSAGITKVYIDGAEVASSVVGNTLGNWIGSHKLHLGAERDASRSWLGTYYLVAFYDRALTPSEVVQNFAFGDV